MSRCVLSGNTKRAAALRAIVAPIAALPGLGLAAFCFGGVSPLFFPAAVAPLYLCWVWLYDLVVLARSAFSHATFRVRPWFVTMAATSVLSATAMWTFTEYVRPFFRAQS